MSSSSPTKSTKSSSDAALTPVAGSDEEDKDPNPFPLSICCEIAFNDFLASYWLFLAGKTRDLNNVLREKLESYMYERHRFNGYTQLKNAITFKRQRF